MFVVCCIGNSLCDGLISHSQESYWVCVLNVVLQCGGLGPIWAIAQKKERENDGGCKMILLGHAI